MAAYNHEFQSYQLEAFLFEAFDNVGNEPAMDSIRFEHNKGPFLLCISHCLLFSAEELWSVGVVSRYGSVYLRITLSTTNKMASGKAKFFTRLLKFQHMEFDAALQQLAWAIVSPKKL